MDEFNRRSRDIPLIAFEDITKFIKKLLDQLADKGEKYILKHGFDATDCPVPFWKYSGLGASTPEVVEALMPESLAYHLERGRRPQDVILTVTVQMGIEQGYRIALRDNITSINIGEKALHEESLKYKEISLEDRMAAAEKIKEIIAAKKKGDG